MMTDQEKENLAGCMNAVVKLVFYGTAFACMWKYLMS